MPEAIHPLLLRQLRRLGLDAATAPADAAAWSRLIERVGRAYTQAEQDRYLLERSQDIASAEMAELYQALQAERDRLESRVRERTEELQVSQARLASLVSLSSDWIWEQDEQLQFTYFSEGLQQATSSPTFPVRMVGGLFSTVPDFEELAPRLKNYENDLLKIPFVKTWTDGSLQGGTGHLSEGYHLEEMGGGGAIGDQDFFNKQVLRIYELGYWPAIHANGDGAMDVALNAIEYAQKSVGDRVKKEIRPSNW